MATRLIDPPATAATAGSSAKRLRSLEVDRQLERGRALYRHIGWTRTFEDPIDIDRRASGERRDAATVCHEATRFDNLTPVVHGWQPMSCRQLENPVTLGAENDACDLNESVRSLRHHRRKGPFIVGVSNFDHNQLNAEGRRGLRRPLHLRPGPRFTCRENCDPRGARNCFLD
jgi:hypothetical protein